MSWENEQRRPPMPPGTFPQPNVGVTGGHPTYTYTPSQRPQAQHRAHIDDRQLGPPYSSPPSQFPLRPEYRSEYTNAVPRALADHISYQPATGYVTDSQPPLFPQAPGPAQAPNIAHTPGHARAHSHATYAQDHTRIPSPAYPPSHTRASRAPGSAQPPPHMPYVANVGGSEYPYLLQTVPSGGPSYGEASTRASYDYGPPIGSGGPSIPVPRPHARPSFTPAQPQPHVGHRQVPPTQVPASQSPRVGRKKALLIGINYSKHRDHRLRLNGCIDDAKEMARFLKDHLGFHPNDIRILTDDHQGIFDSRKSSPTEKHILSGMSWLIEGAQPGDSLFFYFSGHATQIRDEDEDEMDGFDECLCALDYDNKTNPPTGLIVDDKIHDLMVKPLPQGCRLTAVLDCCNSGTLLDLPYIYNSRGVLKQNNPRVVERKRSEAAAISLSACKDGSPAFQMRGRGALREAFIDYMMRSMRSGNQGTHVEVIQSLRNHMVAKGLPQIPQLSSSHWINTDERFTIIG